MIKDFKDLEKLFKLCRKQGVFDMDFQGIKFKLGDLPHEQTSISPTNGETEDSLSGFPAGILSQEQLMFYSAGGLPSDDPYLKDGAN